MGGMGMQISGKFEITEHFEVTGRGAYVVGRIRDGAIGIGDKVPGQNTTAIFTICGIECADNLRERKFWNALLFEEQPSLSDVRAEFPIGSCVEVYEGEHRE